MGEKLLVVCQDESFLACMYSLLQKQVQWQKVHQIVHEAVDIETEFVCDALPCALIGMNAALMSQYIKFVADHLLVGRFLFYP